MSCHGPYYFQFNSFLLNFFILHPLKTTESLSFLTFQMVENGIIWTKWAKRKKKVQKITGTLTRNGIVEVRQNTWFRIVVSINVAHS